MAHHDFIEYPQPQQDDTQYEFSAEELAAIQKHIAKYPDKTSAVMPALWIAQEKYGWLPQGAIKLVADTLGLSFAHVYGVATFYTMYLKEYKAKHLVEICTCFSCGECGGEELFAFAKKYLHLDEEGVSPDKLFWVREAECLGACDTAPVVQINNRRMRFNCDEKLFMQIIEDLKAGKEIPFISVPLSKQ
ncbi:MAG: NAD(P)H-dependent oxidoreductase subunit E [Bacteroidia bacterium]|nr:NAD(P)H-dependent oxidoreductase subunit E [Bacteroidia bacterium]MDW8159542.1 NAD(P)H-dependent oxidoreductase subunit E [Bacteroidia bacterium]